MLSCNICFNASKSYLSYKNIFQDIKLILNQNKIEWNYNKIRITYDFEKITIKSNKRTIQYFFNPRMLFSLFEISMEKSKKLGLTKSKFLKNTKIIVFTCKIYPFILEENKSSFIKFTI